MQNFEYHSPTKIIFGKGAERKVGKECAPLGDKVLLHYGGESIKRIGLYDRVIAAIKHAGVNFIELGGVKPNPRLSLVREGIALCKKEGITGILVVGGGSPIDSAKAIAAGACCDGDVWDFFTGKATVEKALPIGVVLTIPAAGSEVSPGAVVTHEAANEKYFINAQCLRPCFALMNPQITFSLTAEQTAIGCADIMAHVVERYFTNEPHVDLSDRLCESVFQTVIGQLPKVLENLKDYHARAEIMWAGTIAHNDLIGKGRSEDWASHVIEHELSAEYDVPHGAGLATVVPAWMTHVWQANPARFVQFAERVWGVDGTGKDEASVAKEGIRRLQQFWKSVGLPTSLPELGVTDNRYETMAGRALRFGPIGGFKKLEKDDIIQIYTLAEKFAL